MKGSLFTSLSLHNIFYTMNKYINDFVSAYNNQIIIVCFITIIMIILYIINKIFKIIKLYIKRKIITKEIIEELLNLSEKENEIIRTILKSENLNIKVDMNSGIIFKLQEEGIIEMSNSQYVTTTQGNFPKTYADYTINPKYHKFINKNSSLRKKFYK